MPLDLHDLEADRRFRNFNWEKARSFYIVAKMGSFSKAAVFLHASQSALSRQVLELEKALDTRLFIRIARGVRLTRKGEELYAIIESTFSDLKGFTHNIHAETNQGKKRKIRISTTHAITSYILDTHILAYLEEHPHLVFELVSEDHMIDILLNDVDIAIRPFDPKARNVQQKLLFTLEKKLFASQSYIDKYGEPETEAELKNHRMIAHAHPEENPYSDLQWILKLGMPKDEQHEPVFTSNSLEIAVEAAKKGIGIIGCYEEMRIIKESNLKNIVPHVKDKKIECYFIYPDHLQEDKEILNLRNYLENHISKIM